MNRRLFIKRTAVTSIGLTVLPTVCLASNTFNSNKLIPSFLECTNVDMLSMFSNSERNQLEDIYKELINQDFLIDKSNVIVFSSSCVGLPLMKSGFLEDKNQLAFVNKTNKGLNFYVLDEEMSASFITKSKEFHLQVKEMKLTNNLQDAILPTKITNKKDGHHLKFINKLNQEVEIKKIKTVYNLKFN